MSKRRDAIAENWVAYPCSLIESPAMRVLSQAAVRVMHRLEVEHMHHGGAENGRLIVTRDQFVGWGIERNAIAPAVRELAALGFVEITEKGCAGNANQHKATQYRLTYVNSKNREQPTNEWRRSKPWIVQSVSQPWPGPPKTREPMTWAPVEQEGASK